jgi:acetolactate synthase-1/2/3 large subunit
LQASPNCPNCRAYGEYVREPQDGSAAINRCLAALDDGRAAVLTVRVTPL